MTETLTGMKLKARKANGEVVEQFQVKWIGQLAFGVIDENTTNKDFLELFVEDKK